jgi:nucleoside-diphosphate-sugar epimerase
MKALVAGATGFIGSVLVRDLLVQGHHVKTSALPGEDVAGRQNQGVMIDPASPRGICDSITRVCPFRLCLNHFTL